MTCFDLNGAFAQRWQSSSTRIGAATRRLRESHCRRRPRHRPWRQASSDTLLAGTSWSRSTLRAKTITSKLIRRACVAIKRSWRPAWKDPEFFRFSRLTGCRLAPHAACVAGSFALLAVAAGVHIASAVPSFSAILCRREDGPHGRHSVNQARVPIVLARCGERRELRAPQSRRSAHPPSRRRELLEYVH